jgi:nitroreductase
MALTDLIYQRRTIAAFRPEPVPTDLLAELLEVAIYAPNHRLTQPWRFVLLDAETRLQYANLRRDLALQQGKNPQAIYANFIQIPAFIFVVMAQDSDAVTRDEDYAATATLIQNLMLLATERGLGSKWSSFPTEPVFRAWLRLHDNETVVGVVHLGYPAIIPAIKTRVPARQRLATLTANGLLAWGDRE